MYTCCTYLCTWVSLLHDIGFILALVDGMDYQFDVMNVTFSRRQVALPVPIRSDSILERNETFQLKIIIPNSWERLGVSVSPTRNMTEVMIVDNNSVEINFNPSLYTFVEGSRNSHEITLISSLQSSFSYKVQLLSTPMNASGKPSLVSACSMYKIHCHVFVCMYVHTVYICTMQLSHCMYRSMVIVYMCISIHHEY